MAEARPVLTLQSFFGSAANRTRSKSGTGAGAKRRLKATKDVVAIKTSKQIEDGIEDDLFCVKRQKLTCPPAPLDARSRDRVINGQRMLAPTKKFVIGAKQATAVLSAHPDVYEWTKDSQGGRYLRCKYCFDVLDHIDKATPKKIQRHVESPSHKDAVLAWQNHEAKKCVMFQVLKATESHASRRTLSDDQNVFRMATVSAFLSAGICLNKIGALRPFLEQYCNAKLDDVSNLKKVYLPKLQKARRMEIQAAVRSGAQLCIIHDGTNRFSEFYCVVARWSTSDFILEERVIALKAYKGAQKGQELAVMLTSLLDNLDVPMGEFADDGTIVAGGLLAINRDRASVNQKCANVMKLMWMNYMDLECIPHTFSKVGEKMPLAALTVFRDDLLIALNSQSFKAHVLQFLSKSPRKPSPTRWWSTWELYAFMLEQDLGQQTNFHRLLTAFCGAMDPEGHVAVEGVFEDSVRVRRLCEFARDVGRVEDVLLELTVATEVFRPFVHATYALEGAGCCVLEVSPWFHTLASFWRTFEPDLSFPKVRALIESTAAARTARQLHTDHATARQSLEERVRSFINPVTQQLSFVFNSTDGELRSDVLFYTFVATLNPYEHGKLEMQQLIQPGNFKAEVLKHFAGRFDTTQVDLMVLELPLFAQLCAQFTNDNAAAAPDGNHDNTAIHRNKTIWNFWRSLDANNLCPHLRRLAQLTLSVSPSSAASERCFSLLKAYFDAQQLIGNQRGALEDYIEQMIAMNFEENNKKNAFHAAARA
jgi:hypothetical protein